MTKITTMEDRVEQINGILDEMVRYTGEKEALTKDFADVFHLIIPDDGHHHLTLGDWRYSPALEPEITEWLAGDPDNKEGFRPGDARCSWTATVWSMSTPSTCWTATGRSLSSTSFSMRRTKKSRNSRAGMLA